MKRKNRKNKKKSHGLKDAKTHHIHGGEVTFRRVPLMEVIENVRIAPCPGGKMARLHRDRLPFDTLCVTLEVPDEDE